MKMKKEISGLSFPLVSIIMPAFNSEQFILESIESVKKQREKNWELIIVDDYSSDNTVEVVEKEMAKDSRICLFKMPKNKGPSFTRNFGIGKARGEFIAFLDSDDLMSVTSISKRILALQKDRSGGGSYCDIIFIDENGANLGINARYPDYETFIDLYENKFPASPIMLRSSVLKTVGCFDENLRFGEDWDLWLRLTRSGVRFVKASGCKVYYRQHTMSLTHPRIIDDFVQRMKVLDRSWGQDPFCKNPLQEFKNGLGDAMKNIHRTKRAFSTALAEIVRGNREAASKLMNYVSLDILPLLNYRDIAGRCKFMIKRNFCINEREWIFRNKDIGLSLQNFLDQYRTEELETFFDNLLGELLDIKDVNIYYINRKNSNRFLKFVKTICQNIIVNKVLGMLYLITKRINTIIANLYHLKNN